MALTYIGTFVPSNKYLLSYMNGKRLLKCQQSSLLVPLYVGTASVRPGIVAGQHTLVDVVPSQRYLFPRTIWNEKAAIAVQPGGKILIQWPLN